MPKFIVNPDTPEAWEIHLADGVNSLGRDDSNHFPINHPSISGVHCQVTVRDSLVTIKDLGSAAGTMVDGTLINEVRLKPGQEIQLGDIHLRFQMESVAGIAAVSRSGSSLPFCKFHPKAQGRYQCPDCGNYFCELCVSRRTERNMVRKFCRSCGTECKALKTQSAPGAKQEQSFFRRLPSAFAYPFHGDGVILLVAGAIFYSIAAFLASRAVMALAGILVMFFCTGYLISYYQSILETSANGEDKMPDWPDFSNLGALFVPYLQFAGCFLAAFGPAILLNMLAAPHAAWRPWAVGLAVVFGCSYFPMAFTAVAMADSIAGVNPLVIVPSILKILPSYLVTVLLLIAVLGAQWGAQELLDRIHSVPIAPSLLSQFLGLYLVTVIMRILGLLYRCHKDQLQWFTR